MIKEIRLINWKSFKDSILYIDPLTILIGSNASGKSNIVDALAFLRIFVRGDELQSIFDSSIMDSKLGGIRGGSEYAAMFGENSFSLEVVFQKDDKVDYKYKIKIEMQPALKIVKEELDIISTDTGTVVCVFNAETDNSIKSNIIIDKDLKINQLYLGKPYIANMFINSIAVLDQIKNYDLISESKEAVQFVIEKLEGIFVYDPIPSMMRDYVKLSNHLNRDGSNLAGVIAYFNNGSRKNIEESLTKYVSNLPEGEVKRVWTMTVGLKNNDAILCCEEKWGNEKTLTTIDARGMSDGTLRFLGILTALLTRPEGSLIVIEEVDNGLHPSRAKLLLKVLKEIGTMRKIDILITTHNPALMDELGVEMIPFIQVVHRDTEDGTSKITLLEDIKTLPKLLAHGSIGELSTKGELDKSLSRSGVITDAK